MDKEKGFEGFGAGAKEGEAGVESAPRARNRTVMLTPEITGQVRARLAQDLEQQTGFVPRNEIPNEPQVAQPSFPQMPPAAPPRRPQIEQAPVELPQQVMVRVAEPSAIRQGLGSVAAVWSKKTAIVGFLVSFDQDPTGEFVELRSGRLIVTSEPGGGNYLLIRDPSVSTLHAILRIGAAGDIQVLDQLSEQGTKITRPSSGEVKNLSGDKGTVEHGDLLTFGEKTFHVCLLSLVPQARGELGEPS